VLSVSISATTTVDISDPPIIFTVTVAVTGGASKEVACYTEKEASAISPVVLRLTSRSIPRWRGPTG